MLLLLLLLLLLLMGLLEYQVLLLLNRKRDVVKESLERREGVIILSVKNEILGRVGLFVGHVGSAAMGR